MKQQLKCKVIMLPTKDKSKIVTRNDKPTILMNVKESPFADNETHTYQHLYLVSDREIKDGRTNFWTYDHLNHKPLHIDYINYFGNSNQGRGDIKNGRASFITVEGTSSGISHKEIITSTDPSLNLPLIPQSFIEAYIKANGKIDEVNIEIDIRCTKDMFNGDYQSYKQALESISDGCKDFNVIKTREDNTVIIHSVKTYTFQEMKKIAIEWSSVSYTRSNKGNDPLFDEDKEFDKWIEENL